MSLPPDKPRSNAAIDGCAGPPSRHGQNHQGSAREHPARQRSVLLEPAGRRSDRRLPDDPVRSRAPWSSTNRTATSAWPTVGRASGYGSPTEQQRGRPSCYRRGAAARDDRHASPAYAAAHASRADRLGLRGLQNPRLTDGRDALSRLCMAGIAPRTCPAMRSYVRLSPQRVRNLLLAKLGHRMSSTVRPSGGIGRRASPRLRSRRGACWRPDPRRPASTLAVPRVAERSPGPAPGSLLVLKNGRSVCGDRRCSRSQMAKRKRGSVYQRH